MGFFNHLFGSKSDVAREISLDAQRRINLWREHLANFPKRETLAKFFSSYNVDNALANPQELSNKLADIDRLVSRDLVTIENEEITEAEIIRDIDNIISSMKSYEVSHVISIVGRQKRVFQVLKKLYHILKLELYAIKLARKNPNKDILLKLFRLIFHEDAFINNMFKAELYPGDKSNWEDLDRLVKSILLEEELTEETQSAEETFIRNAVKSMGSDKKHKYRRLAEAIYLDFVDETKKRAENLEGLDELVKYLETLILDDALIRQLLLKNKGRIKLSDEELEWLIKAFKKSFDFGHFENLNAEFAT